MIWRLLKHYGMDRAKGLLRDFTSAVAAFDPDTASQAQVVMLEAELMRLARRLAQVEAEIAREQRQTAALHQTFDEYLDALRRLKGSARDATATGPQAARLVRLEDKLQRLKPEIQRALREDAAVDAWRCELRRTFEELAEKVSRSKQELQSARRRGETRRTALGQLGIRRARAAAGMANAISVMSLALDAMNREAAELRPAGHPLQQRSLACLARCLEGDPSLSAGSLKTAGGDSHVHDGKMRARQHPLRTESDATRLPAVDGLRRVAIL